MKLSYVQLLENISDNTVARTTVYVMIVIGMSNLNALVDLALHPDIPYFHAEHLIVGGVTGLVSSILFGILFVYTRHLRNALSTIKTLEGILPICSNCRKIRKPDSPLMEMSSWEPLESYIMQRTTTTFSHGLCPECVLKLYPELADNKKTNQSDVR